MKFVSSLSDADLDQPSVVSIGNFDGLHLGHQAILKTVVEEARRTGVRSAAMTFTPHPIRFLAPGRAPRLILTLEQKIRRIREAGIDLLFVVGFDEEFSRLSPEEFIRQYLVGGLKARTVCVGSNFNFGHRQAGTVATLRPWAAHFNVIEVPPVIVRGTIVSSSRIREFTNAGEVSQACRLLGRWLEIEGSIVSGAGRGRSVTVPTLNLRPDNELIPAIGVYVSQISIDDGPYLEAITNIGVRPTFGETDIVIETFVLNGDVPAQSAAARLRFLKHLRDEVRFDSAEALRHQIGRDVARAQKFFRLLRGVRHGKTR